MHNLLKFYNQNRKKIWTVVFGIVLVIAILQLLNTIAKNKGEEKLNNISNSSSNNTTTIANELKSSSAITGVNISEAVTNENTEVIDKFIEYCNNSKIEEAYNLLSEECKELVFPNIEYFQSNYYNNIFKNKRNYEIELWIANDNRYTYRIKFLDDILSSGTIDNSENYYDYYTVVENEDNQKKLNLSSYIGREYIDSRGSSDNIEIQAISKDMYMDYEVYNIVIKNNTENTILLDSKENTNTVYLEDTNEVKYSSFLYEVDKELLKIDRKQSRSLKIKFNKMYNPERKIDRIYFTNVILNYNEYITNSNNYDNIEQIIVDV